MAETEDIRRADQNFATSWNIQEDSWPGGDRGIEKEGIIFHQSVWFPNYCCLRHRWSHLTWGDQRMRREGEWLNYISPICNLRHRWSHLTCFWSEEPGSGITWVQPSCKPICSHKFPKFCQMSKYICLNAEIYLYGLNKYICYQWSGEWGENEGQRDHLGSATERQLQTTNWISNGNI